MRSYNPSLGIVSVHYQWSEKLYLIYDYTMIYVDSFCALICARQHLWHIAM